MANQGAKKRKEENVRHMARLRQVIIACNVLIHTLCQEEFSDEIDFSIWPFFANWIDSNKQVVYVLIRMLIFHSSFTWKHWIGLAITSAAYWIPYQQLAKMANPAYAQDGELLDGGFDMTTGGVCGYVKDC